MRTGPKLWWLVPAIVAALGSSPPEIVKVRVPSSKISSWFPPGSDLQVLPYDRFELLAKAALGRAPTPRAPRLLKARHHARWEAGRLLGRTELTVERSPDVGGGLLILEPWSPALIDRGDGVKLLRASPDGKLGLKVEPAGAERIEFEWVLRARSGSGDRAFALDLPGLDVSTLSLDLPTVVVPEATAGPRIGPVPGPTPGRSTWHFEAAEGRIALRLQDASDQAPRANAPTLWLEGTTKVDLGASPINWRADWTLDESPGAPRALTIGLDPGLEVVDISGPRVSSFRLESKEVGSKALIRLDGEGSGPSLLTIRAICQVPAEGTWSVPSARPLDARWTGGRTVVRLGASRVFQSCQERSGRRIPPRSSDPSEVDDLIFEPKGSPGPAAELTFRKPTADATVEVRGLLRLGDEISRIEVALTWSVEKGKLQALAADLPPGWTPDGVVSSVRQPVAWHSDPLGNGGTRVHLGSFPADDASRSITLTLAASARKAAVTGPLDLPRVRPAPGARIIDEIWVATPDPSLAIRPILGRGLAWLDPPDPPLDDVPTPWVADDLARALAWRWLAEDAEARIDRALPPSDTRGEVSLDATIRADRLELEWSIEIESSRGDFETIPVHIEGPVEGSIQWRTGESRVPILDPRPMDEARRALLGFPSTGQAWDLKLSEPAKGKVRVVSRLDRPWTGRERLPLLTLPQRYRMRGLLAVVVENSTRVKVDSTGLTSIDPAAPVRESVVAKLEGTLSSNPPLRKAAIFGYRSSGGRLVVETTDARIGAEGGIVLHAFLNSRVFPGSGMRHRLTLAIATDLARSIALTMPHGVVIDRLRRDGLTVAATASEGRFLVDIPGPGPGRPLSSLTIDYRTDDDPRNGPIEPSAVLPVCSFPCLDFAWEVVAPEPWALTRTGRGLEATAPPPPPSIAFRLLGFPWSSWSERDQNQVTTAGKGMLLDLDKAAADIADGESNFGNWILKLDAGRWPLILDRLAIRSAGWGPGSRIGSTPGEAKPVDNVRSVLEPMGLVAIPLQGMILITSRDVFLGQSTDRAGWGSTVQAVTDENSDATDRFQSAARWRRESTPRALTAGDSTERPGGNTGWHTWWIVSNGWPAPGAFAFLVDKRADRAWGWFVTSAILVAGLLARRRPAKPQALGILVIGVMASAGLGWHWPVTTSTDTGLLRGGLALLAFWLGRALRLPSQPPTPPHPGEISTTSRRGGLASGLSHAPILAIAIGIGVTSVSISSETEADTPILALLPFDGPAEPGTKPDRVILLVKDHERLELLAKGVDPASIAGVTLVSAIHKVGRAEPGLASVESSFGVEVDGPGPASWSLPVGMALELSADVDDRPAALAISPDGLSATVTLEGTGPHRLRFRRLVPLLAIGRGGEQAQVPINRAAFARVSVAKGGGPSWVEVAKASGDLSVEVEGIKGGLGPLDRLEVRWFPENRPPAAGLQGSVEATFLWDARPVGDLIRMRMAHAEPEAASTIRIATEPGLVVRRYSIPDIVSIEIGGTVERPEWVAHVDPPLPRDVPIEVDFWRDSIPGTVERRWPEIDVPTASKFSGLIGFRRPGDWTGRLEARVGVEATSEASFARAWGGLPDDGLTLAGVARHARSKDLLVETRPVLLQRSISTSVILDLVPGRLNALIEGALNDRQGRSFELEATIPSDFRIVRIEANGLVDWQKISRDRLRLQFDGSEARDRKVQIEGYLSAPANESVMSETRTYQAKVPWPRWSDSELTQGTLEITSPTRFQFDAVEGFVPLPLSESKESTSSFRSIYRVEQPSGPSALHWSSPAAKVSVAVESELTIDPSSLTWTAALTYDVSGGPADSLSLNLPTEWANAATLEIEGLTHRLVSQPNGAGSESTQWKIVPESPIWGRARMILRSRQAFRPGREFSYPQVAPLAATGRGSVGRYDLAILNVSGRVMEMAGSSGLQPIDVSRFRDMDSASSVSGSRSLDHAYHVTGERWSLRLKVGRPGEEAPSASEIRETRVAFAQLSCLIKEDGTTWGRACYDLEARPGPFLSVRLPAEAKIPWLTVDGAIGPALVDGPGRWLISLGDRQPRQVTFAWHEVRPRLASDRGESLSLPATDRPATTTLISVEAPDNLDLAISGVGVDRIGRGEWEVFYIEQLARGVVDALSNLDRSSRRDREAIVADLAEIELRMRHINRLSIKNDKRTNLDDARLEAALASMTYASEASGLEELVQEARARVGVAQAIEDSAGNFAGWTPEVVRLRRSGESHFFRSSGAGAKSPLEIIGKHRVANRPSSSVGSWGVAGCGILFWMGIGSLIVQEDRRRLWVTAVLMVFIGLASLAWEPVAILPILGLLGLGRISN